MKRQNEVIISSTKKSVKMDDTTARDDSFINFDSEDVNEKIDNHTTGKKVWRFFKKFFLAVIAIGLVAALVF